MTTITIPSDLEASPAEAARRRGTTPAILAVETLQRVYPSAEADGGSSADFFAGFVGTIDGSREAWSERTARR